MIFFDKNRNGLTCWPNCVAREYKIFSTKFAITNSRRILSKHMAWLRLSYMQTSKPTVPDSGNFDIKHTYLCSTYSISSLHCQFPILHRISHWSGRCYGRPCNLLPHYHLWPKISTHGASTSVQRTLGGKHSSLSHKAFQMAPCRITGIKLLHIKWSIPSQKFIKKTYRRRWVLYMYLLDPTSNWWQRKKNVWWNSLLSHVDLTQI